MTPAERLAVDLDRLDPEQRRSALDVIAELAREARARSSADRALADLLDQSTSTTTTTCQNASMRIRELPSRVKAGAYRSAKARLRGVRVELRRLPKQPDAVADGYYRPPRSCQIPNLGFLYELFFGRRSDGFFVEVGAYDGISFSNTSCLAEAGWQGLFIEPVPEFAQRCRARYAGNELIEVIECAVGSSDTPIELLVGGPLTTANQALASEYADVPWSKEIAANMRSIEVPQVRLDDLLSERPIAPGFDLLVVDVEGFEASVMRGGHSFFTNKKPSVVVFEENRNQSHEQAESISIMQSYGYDIFALPKCLITVRLVPLVGLPLPEAHDFVAVHKTAPRQIRTSLGIS
jgi:FkbM family methyltransferase